MMLEPAIDIVHLYHTNPEDQDDDDESTTPTSKPFNQVQTLELFARSMLISSRSILTTDAVYSTRKLRHGNAQFIPLLLSAKRKLPLHPKIRPQICIVLPRQPVILVATSPEYIPTLLDALSMSNCEANGDRTLVQEPYPKENLAFLEQAGIRFFQFPIPGNKEPFVVIPDVSIIGALETILDKRNHPILVHCNAGKHRTGCLMGILRRLQGWALTPVLAEYRMYASPKERVMDQMFIELFDVGNLCGRVEEENLETRWGVQVEEDI